LALNEKRAPFSPTLWKLKPNNQHTKLKQVWFPGVHCAVGGGDKYHGLSSITLAWMVQKLSKRTHLEYSMDYLRQSRETFEPIIKGVKINEMSEYHWACSPYTDSYQGIFRLSGRKARTPNRYHEKEGERTNESIHKSVYERKEFMPSYTHPDFDGLLPAKFGNIEREMMWHTNQELFSSAGSVCM
jgi:hypothetical protein